MAFRTARAPRVRAAATDDKTACHGFQKLPVLAINHAKLLDGEKERKTKAAGASRTDRGCGGVN